MPYRAGELDQRVTIQRIVQVTNEYGTIEEKPQDVATVWAHVRPMSGQERERAGQEEADANYLVVMRYRHDLRHDHVLQWRGQPLDIVFIKDRGPRATYLEVETERARAVA